MRGRWLTVAGILHGAAILALRLLPVATPSRVVVDHRDPHESQLEIPIDVQGAAEGSRPTEERGDPPSTPGKSPTRTAAVRDRTAVTPPAPASADDQNAMGETSTVSLVRPPQADIGLGRNAFLAPGSLPESHAPLTANVSAPTRERDDAKKRVEQALRQPARDRERELGLGPEGPVLRALGDAASATPTPVNGHATFVATANGNGDVVSVDVVHCDGAREGWLEAASAALAALRGKKLRLPGSSAGAEMKIELTSAWKLPSGRDPGVDVSIAGIPIKKGGEGKDATKVELLNPLPKIVMVPITTDGKDRVPVLVWQLTILGTNGDPADVGASPRRIIHTRLVDSKVL